MRPHIQIKIITISKKNQDLDYRSFLGLEREALSLCFNASRGSPFGVSKLRFPDHKDDTSRVDVHYLAIVVLPVVFFPG